MFISLISFLGVLTILVFIHEFGHYIVARWNGVRVEVFSIGFGKELFGWTDKVGTRWKFSLIPLGGYVKMYGDQDAASSPDSKALLSMKEEEKKYALHHKNVWARIAVAAAGPIANYLLAFVIFTGLYVSVGKPYLEPVLSKVVENSAAETAGLKIGDRVVSVEGHLVNNFNDLVQEVQRATLKKDELTLRIYRNDHSSVVLVRPTIKENKDIFGNVTRQAVLGVVGSEGKAMQYGFFGAMKASVKEIGSFTSKTLSSVGQMLTGKRGASELGGVLRIAKISGDVAAAGIVPLLSFMAVLSLALGLINLFPIPMLDGGHIAIYLAEVVRGKPLPEKVVEIAFRIGFFLIIGLMVIALWNDITQMKVFDFFAKWFK